MWLYKFIYRYFAILCPHSNKNQWFTGRSHIILSFGWILGCVLGHLAMVHTTTVPFIWDNQTFYDCRGAEMDEFETKIYNTLLFVLTFALPLVSLLSCFIDMFFLFKFIFIQILRSYKSSVTYRSGKKYGAKNWLIIKFLSEKAFEIRVKRRYLWKFS